MLVQMNVLFLDRELSMFIVANKKSFYIFYSSEGPQLTCQPFYLHQKSLQ